MALPLVGSWLSLSVFLAVTPVWAEAPQVSTLPLPPVTIVEDKKQKPAETLPAQTVSTESSEPVTNPDPASFKSNRCDAFLLNQDMKQRYEKLQKQMESDFESGLPSQMKAQLVKLRKDLDAMTAQLFDLDSTNNQEVNGMINKTINKLETIISLIPKAQKMAPKVLNRYMVPFTNINSLRADQQDCLMKAAIEEAKSEKMVAGTQDSFNIYKNLTDELKAMNENLYSLQTSDVQYFIRLRGEMIKAQEQYNKDPGTYFGTAQKLPQIYNSLQNEIEKMMPGLELTKKYYSLAQ